MRNTIIQGDVLDPVTWADIPDQHVQTCITSPPYWGLRDYGVEGQLGLESTPEEYIERMVAVFRHVWRVLRDDGTLWLNMGDSYASGTSMDRRSRDGYSDGRKNHKERFSAGGLGLKPKDLCGIPWRVALALQADGWYLRQDIIWHKPNPMPESCRDRCTKAHEYIFLLTKRPRYFCDMGAVKEPADTAGQIGGFTPVQSIAAGIKPHGNQLNPEYVRPATRNKRSVWTIATAPYKEAHFATFPPKLIEPCILAGTSAKGCCPECGKPWVRVVEKSKTFQSGSGKSGNPISGKNGPECQGGGDTGDIRKGPCVSSVTTDWELGCECYGAIRIVNIGPDGEELSPGETYGVPVKTRRVYEAHKNLPQPIPCIVFDPFMGSGTTGMVAKQHGRDYLGIELNPEYIGLIHKRIATAEPAVAPTPLFDGLDK